MDTANLVKSLEYAAYVVLWTKILTYNIYLYYKSILFWLINDNIILYLRLKQLKKIIFYRHVDSLWFYSNNCLYI